VSVRCLYLDLDGTLLGKGASLFHDADGGFTLLPARALEACHRAGIEVVIKSGRRKAQVMEDARLLGQTSYIYEVGCGLVVDGVDRGLHLVLPDRSLGERVGDERHALGDEILIPARAVLLGERDELAVGAGASGTAGFGEQHEGEQADDDGPAAVHRRVKLANVRRRLGAARAG